MPKGIPGSKAPHGTPTRYNGHGCRCDACRVAWSEYKRPIYGTRPRAEYLASIAAVCGTERRYKNGCRCNACRRASREARADRRARAAA